MSLSFGVGAGGGAWRSQYPLVGGTELQEQREAKGDWRSLSGPPSLPT